MNRRSFFKRLLIAVGLIKVAEEVSDYPYMVNDSCWVISQNFSKVTWHNVPKDVEGWKYYTYRIEDE